MTGCTGLPKNGQTKAGEDPLLGATAPPVNATPLPINTGANPPPVMALPPLTQATPTSNAALASGSYPPLVGGNDLRIGPAPTGAGGNKIQSPHLNPPGVLAVVTADNGQPQGTNTAGVVPLDSTGTRPVNPTYPAPASFTGGGIDQAMATLSQYNPRWTKLENGGPGIWRFSCSVPDRAEPTKARTFEAEATSAVGAIQNVIERLRQS
ncbi:MAG: hypothetical protein ACJ8C4_08840 [Gemmataceae bacterium]